MRAAADAGRAERQKVRGKWAIAIRRCTCRGKQIHRFSWMAPTPARIDKRSAVKDTFLTNEKERLWEDEMTLALPRMLVLAPLLLMGAPLASRADDTPPTAGILQRLTEQSGVHSTSKTGKTPDFVVDPAWPQPLPQLAARPDRRALCRPARSYLGLQSAAHHDHRRGWAGRPVPGATDEKGQPVNGLGQERA